MCHWKHFRFLFLSLTSLLVTIIEAISEWGLQEDFGRTKADTENMYVVVDTTWSLMDTKIWLTGVTTDIFWSSLLCHLGYLSISEHLFLPKGYMLAQEKSFQFEHCTWEIRAEILNCPILEPYPWWMRFIMYI